jgi:hypothetical protein
MSSTSAPTLKNGNLHEHRSAWESLHGECNNPHVGKKKQEHHDNKTSSNVSRGYLELMLSFPKTMFRAVFESVQGLFYIDIRKEGNPRSGFKFLWITLFVTICSFPITILPKHNLLKFPKYWPERYVITPLISSFMAGNFVFDSILVMNTENINPAKMFLYCFLYNSFPRIILHVIMSLVWIYALKYHPLSPYNCILTHAFGVAMLCIGFWFQHPSSMRSESKFRQRLKWFISMRCVRIIINFSYIFFTSLLENVPSQYQFLLALALPMMRHGNRWIQNKMANKARGPNVQSMKFSVGCNVACGHALQLAIVIGSTATDTSLVLICIIDILLNLWSCFEIVKLHQRQTHPETREIQDHLQALAIKETFELMLPVIYCIILVITYVGPNGDIMGNIKNDSWQYRKIDDIIIPVAKLGAFLLVDCLRIILSSIILSKYCNISLFSEYCRLMEIYWKPITNTICVYLYAVSTCVILN